MKNCTLTIGMKRARVVFVTDRISFFFVSTAFSAWKMEKRRRN